MVADWEYSYNGLTFGAAQSVGVMSATGLEPPDYREDISVRMGEHGGYVFAQYVDPRRVIFELDLISAGGTDAFTLYHTMKAAFVPQSANLPLVFKWPGQVQRRINCVPSRIAFPIDRDMQIGNARSHVELIAGDPRIYADTASTAAITTSGATIVANNAGDAPTLFNNAVITGPGTTFTIRDNADAARTVVVNTTLTAGQTMTINFIDRTIVKSDGSSLYPSLAITSQWWALNPGNTTVLFTVGSGATGATRLDMTWRSAWW